MNHKKLMIFLLLFSQVAFALGATQVSLNKAYTIANDTTCGAFGQTWWSPALSNKTGYNVDTYGGGQCATGATTNFTIDLGQAYNISTATFGTTAASNNPNNLTLWYSTDNSSWTRLVTLTTSTQGWFNTTFANTSAQYWRFNMRCTAGCTNGAYITAIALYSNITLASSNMTVFLNDTRLNTSMGNFSYNFTTTNGSDTNSKSGYCSTALGCSITNYTGTLTINIFNVSGGTYFNPVTSPLTYIYNATNNSYTFGTFASNFTITNVSNSVNGSIINNYCVNVSNSTASFVNCTMTGSLVAYNVIGNLTIFYYNISDSNYFNVTQNIGTYNTTNNNYYNMSYQALIFVQPYQLYLNTLITGFNTTNGLQKNSTVSSSNEYIQANNGTNNIQINVAGNYSQNYTVTINSPLTTVNYNATGIYDNLYTIGAQTQQNISIASFSVNIYNSTLGGSLYTSSTSTGNVTVPTVQGYYYQFNITANGYAQSNITTQSTAATNLYNFTLRGNNSIYSHIYDEATGAPVLINITATATSSASTYSNQSNTSNITLSGLASGVYSITYTGGSYVARSYGATVVDNTAQDINVYMTNASNTVIFTVQDSVSSNAISNAYVTMSRSINGTNTIVQSGYTDLTGKIQFSFTSGVTYSFTVTAASYTTKSFILSPILYSAYTIPLTSGTPSVPSTSFAGLILSINPTQYTNSATNNMTLSLLSPYNLLRTYSFTIRYPGGSGVLSGNTSAGQTYNFLANITGAQVLDTLNVSVTYTDANNNSGTRNYTYTINQQYTAINQTIFANANNNYGMGWFERVLISTVLIIFAAGFCTMLAGPIAGAAVGLFVMGILIHINMIPTTAGIVAICVAFLIIARRTE